MGAAPGEAGQENRAGTSYPVFLVALSALLIVAGGIVFYRIQQDRAEQDARNMITAISRLKAGQIEEWRERQFAEGRRLIESPSLRQIARDFMLNPSGDATTQLSIRLTAMRDSVGAKSAGLVLPDGTPLRIARGIDPGPGHLDPAFIGKAIDERRPLLTDLHIPEGRDEPEIDLVVPLFSDIATEAPCLFLVVMRYDPHDYLYPLIQTWPVPSATAESLLVERIGDRVVFLNELRHRADAAVRYRIPLESTDVVSVAAVRGTTGVVEGTDYRGKVVLAHIRPISGSEWLMVNKIDKAEAWQAWKLPSRVILALILVLLIVLLLSLTLLWSIRRKTLYRNLYRAEAAVHRTEDRLRAMLLSVGDGVVATDMEGRIEFMNRAAEILTGILLEECSGMPMNTAFTILDEVGGKPVADPVRMVLELGRTVSPPDYALLVSKSGFRHTITLGAAPVRDKEKRVTGVVIVFHDQTADRAIRTRLLESERTYRRINDSSIDFIYSYDISGRFTAVNRSLCEHLGLEENAILGRTHAELGFPRETCDEWQELHDRVVRTGAAVDGTTTTTVRPDIRKYWEVHLRPIFDEEQRIVGISGITRDITDRQTADERLYELGEIFRLLLVHSPAYVFVKDAELRILHASDNFSRLLQIESAALAGKRAGDVLPPELAQDLTRIDREVLATGNAVESTIELRGRVFSTLAFPIVMAGIPKFIVGYATDITERILLERETEQANRILEARVRERTALLTAANHELEVFASSVSQDLRGPLRSLDGFAHLLATGYSDVLDGKGIGYLRRIQANARRMNALVEALLRLSRVARSAFVAKPLDLSALAAQTVAEMREANPDRSVEVRIEAGMRATGDEHLLRIAFAGLLDNAWKFTGTVEHPLVEIGSEAADDENYTGVFVRDNGVGFDTRYAENLFQPFHRLHGAEEYPGAGMGLATVHRVIARHGGSIRAESGPGMGARFRFTLPVVGADRTPAKP